MRKPISAIFALFAALMLSVPAIAQSSTVVQGTMTDAETGEPIIGGSILVKGSTIGSVSDIEGNYKLEYKAQHKVVVYSCIGYKDVEKVIEPGKVQVLDIKLEQDTDQLEESVVIGYGTVKKKDLTGAIGTTKGDGLVQANATSLSASLQGTIPGLQVTRSSALPGASATLRIRGVTNMSDSDPLVLLDGVPISSIDAIPAEDIETVTVLKDAASASIYGARAAAGVILLTSKRADQGKMSVTYTGNFSVITPTEFPETVSLTRFFEMQNEIEWNDGGNVSGQEYSVYSKDLIDNYMTYHNLDPDNYPLTDWKKLLVKNWAPQHKHNVSISYGNNVIKTNASFTYENTDALYENRSEEVYNIAVATDIKILKWLKVTADLRFRDAITTHPQNNPLQAAYLYGPNKAAYWEDGRYGAGHNGSNAIYIMEQGGYVNGDRRRVMAKLGFEITPVTGLTITGVYAPNYNLYKSKDYSAQLYYYSAENPNAVAGYATSHETTSVTETRQETVTITKQLTANYNTTFGSNHNFSIMAGYEDYSYDYEAMTGSGDHYELTGYPYLSKAPSDYVSVTGSETQVAYLSTFGRVMYDYKHKYLFQANIRGDASSRFAKGYRWGVFPSVSGGWVMTEEPWMHPAAGWLDFLKIRASYGTLGNERIGNYPYQAIMSLGETLIDSNSGIISAMTAAQTAYNIRDITWETTKTYDFGADLSFFNSRLTANFDWYHKVTTDMLLDLEIPDLIGYTNPSQNAGTMYTNGWELSLGWRDRVGKFGYSINFNISDYKTMMGNLSGVVIDGDQIVMEGAEYLEWYGYKTDGLFLTEEDLANSPKLNEAVQVGDIKFVDISGPDGVPDGEITPEYDRVLLGGSLPRFVFGGNINFDFYGFDVGITFNGVGKQLVQMTQQMVFHTAAWHTFPSYLDGNYFSYYNTDEQNAKAFFPRLSQQKSGSSNSYNYEMSDYWLFNGAYFRLKNVTIGYTFPQWIVDKLKIQKVRVFASVSDPLSISNYPQGWDPEAAYNAYIARTWNFGLTIKF